MPTPNWPGGSTAKWRRTRMQVLDRDHGRCQVRLPGCTTVATQVHHTQPRQFVGDDPRYLLAACSHCNHAAGEPGEADPAPAVGQWW